MRRRRCSQKGVTILEVVLACAILTVAAIGLLGPFSISISQNKNQGEIASRTSEYAEDKIEQLLALNYTDTVSDSSQYPTASSGGTGLADGGGTNPASPVTGYVDYLDINGAPLGTTSTNSFYKRVWQISTAGNLKTVTVVSTAPSIGKGIAPVTTLVCFKSN